MRIEMEIKGEIVPNKRPRAGNGYIYNVPEYAYYKEGLAKEIRFANRAYVIDIPPTCVPQHRKKFLKEQKTVQYSLACWFWRTKDNADLSNCIKTLEDAIQDAGIIFNDKQIKRYVQDPEIFIDTENPRIKFILERIN